MIFFNVEPACPFSLVRGIILGLKRFHTPKNERIPSDLHIYGARVFNMFQVICKFKSVSIRLISPDDVMKACPVTNPMFAPMSWFSHVLTFLKLHRKNESPKRHRCPRDLLAGSHPSVLKPLDSWEDVGGFNR